MFFGGEDFIMIFKDYDKIIFAGDSVTDMGSANPVGEGLFDALGNGYVREVENLLSACYPEVMTRVVNAGISGNTSRMLLERFDRDVVSRCPEWVCICIGINDVWRQFDLPQFDDYVRPDEYESNIEKMIYMLKDTKNLKGIFIASPYYIEPNRDDPMRARMDEYTEICCRLAEKHDCIFVDFQGMFEKYCKIRHSSYLAWDRVHPNRIGAALMAREFLSHCEFDYNNL